MQTPVEVDGSLRTIDSQPLPQQLIPTQLDSSQLVSPAPIPTQLIPRQRDTGKAADQELLDALKIAFVHEWLDTPGGAERVLAEMSRAFPGSDIWSLWDRLPADAELAGRAQTSWLARSPLAGRKALSLPLMPLAWRTLPKRDYDAVLTSTYAFAHLAKFRKNNAVTMHYVHTPARYWWTPEVDGRSQSGAAALARGLMRTIDRRGARNHTRLVANSHETQQRIYRFWGLDASVIHPPVDTEFFTPGPSSTDLPFDEYVLGAGRWVEYKQFDMIIQAASLRGIPVVIAGSGPMEDRLRKVAAAADVPVHFEIRPSHERLRDLYRGARALVFPGHEDFGIVPVEAIACGTPVIGAAIGGLLETVKDGVSGRLVEHSTPQSISEAIDSVPHIDPVSLAAHAQEFSAARFRDELRGWVASSMRAAA